MYLSLLSLLFISRDQGLAIATIAIVILIAVILGWLLATRKRGKGYVLLEDFESYKKQIAKEQKEQNESLEELRVRVSGIKIPEVNAFDSSNLELSINGLKTSQSENDRALDEVAEALKSLEREKDLLSSKEKSLEADVILIKSENDRLKLENEKLWAAINSQETKVVVKEEPKTKEEIILGGIAEKKSLINFASIGEASEADKDDLKLIKGIGPFIEKKLNALDIWTFAQIASFKEEDIESVTKAIEFFPGRISRDNWVSQANLMKN